jgi:hypothetical protein
MCKPGSMIKGPGIARGEVVGEGEGECNDGGHHAQDIDETYNPACLTGFLRAGSGIVSGMGGGAIARGGPGLGAFLFFLLLFSSSSQRGRRHYCAGWALRRLRDV